MLIVFLSICLSYRLVYRDYFKNGGSPALRMTSFRNSKYQLQLGRRDPMITVQADRLGAKCSLSWIHINMVHYGLTSYVYLEDCSVHKSCSLAFSSSNNHNL